MRGCDLDPFQTEFNTEGHRYTALLPDITPDDILTLRG